MNQATLRHTPTKRFIELAARTGFASVGLWRDPVIEVGIEQIRRAVIGEGLQISSYTSGGFSTAPDGQQHAKERELLLQSLDEAARLGTANVVIKSGGFSPGRYSLSDAHKAVRDTLEEVSDYAESIGVSIALEPLHPMFTADRGVINCLESALDVIESIDSPSVRLAIDSYAVWWDPQLLQLVHRAKSKIAVAQFADWVPPKSQRLLTSRAMIGDGVIDFRLIRHALTEAQFTGDIEVEIFNDMLWQQDPFEVMTLALDRLTRHVVS